MLTADRLTATPHSHRVARAAAIAGVLIFATAPAAAAPRSDGATATQAESRGVEVAQGGGLFGGLFGRRGGGGSSDKAALTSAYPGAFRIEGNTVVFANGARMAWDDGRQKSAEQALVDPDVEDMMATPYPLAREGARAPRPGEDPGRVRSDAFFKALYGGSEGEVRASLVSVPFVPNLGGGTLTVTTRFGVDQKIAAISRDLERLPREFHKYLTPPGGAFNWRAIAGTDRLSVHSFGAAVDINTQYSDYWRWAGHTAGGAIPYRNRIPMEIVEVFEKHCFIWGGRWYHYDTMHFEYRPELIPACHR